MSDPGQEFQQFLERQRADFGLALPDRVSQIEASWQEVGQVGHDSAALTDFERLAHSLAGTAGTLGFAAVGRAAGVVEQLAHQACACGVPLSAVQCAEIEVAVHKLRDSLMPDN